VFENRALRRIFEPKRKKIKGEVKTFQNVEFRNIITLIKSGMRWAGRVARIGKTSNAYLLLRKSERKTSLQRSRSKWENNIKNWCEGVDWIHLTQRRDQWWTLVNTGMNL
jgi:hypothetical protein